LTDIGDKAGEGLNKAFYVSGDEWPWLATRNQLVANALGGIIGGCIASFFVLTIMTGNLIISIVAVFCQASIIFQMLGVVYLSGWNFGLSESTCVIVFIGISVDYVVHICH